MLMEITDERVEAALKYLAATDVKLGELKSDVARLDFLVKLRESKHYLTSDGTIDERKAKAKCEPDVVSAYEEQFSAIAAYEAVKAKRERAVILVDLYRTISANRRQGAL
jgi:hypothetical protein